MSDIPPSGHSGLGMPKSMPTELLIQVFLRTPSASSVLKCRLVCALFRHIIDTTPVVQYHLRLLAWGYEDATTATGDMGSVPSRLSKLESHVHNWTNLNYDPVLFTVPNQGMFVFAGGVLAFVRLEDRNQVMVMDAPSRHLGITDPSIRYTYDLDWIVAGLAIDPEQDLIALIQRPERIDQKWKGTLHLLRLSDMSQRHPLVDVHTKTLECTATEECGWRVQIDGDSLAIMTPVHTADNNALVLDWKTAETIWQSTTGVFTMHLIDPGSLLISYPSINVRFCISPDIHLFKLRGTHPHPNPYRTQYTLSKYPTGSDLPAATFELPPLPHTIESAALIVGDLSPSSHTFDRQTHHVPQETTASTIPFKPSRNPNYVMISFLVMSGSPDEEGQTYSIFVDSEIFLRDWSEGVKGYPMSYSMTADCMRTIPYALWSEGNVTIVEDISPPRDVAHTPPSVMRGGRHVSLQDRDTLVVHDFILPRGNSVASSQPVVPPNRTDRKSEFIRELARADSAKRSPPDSRPFSEIEATMAKGRYGPHNFKPRPPPDLEKTWMDFRWQSKVCWKTTRELWIEGYGGFFAQGSSMVLMDDDTIVSIRVSLRRLYVYED